MAWLHAAPKPEKKRNIADRPEPEPVSRIKQMVADGADVPMPPLSANWLVDIVDMLMDVGPVEQSGMGPMQIGWQTLDAWQRQTESKLAPWEARLIRRLSGDFLAESHRAEKPDCPAPWMAVNDASRELVAQKLKAAFGARVERSKRR